MDIYSNLAFSLMLLISGTVITLGSPIKEDGAVRVEITVGRLFSIKTACFQNLVSVENPFATAISFTAHA